MPTKRELFEAEDAAWAELHGALESLSPQQLEEPGYLPNWSVKDLMAHLAAWQAEATHQLERIANRTYRSEKVDVDAMNEQFYQATHDLPLPVVEAELWSARTRMLQALEELPADADDDGWFRESGPVHYQEHLERLHEWIEELQARV